MNTHRISGSTQQRWLGKLGKFSRLPGAGHRLGDGSSHRPRRGSERARPAFAGRHRPLGGRLLFRLYLRRCAAVWRRSFSSVVSSPPSAPMICAEDPRAADRGNRKANRRPPEEDRRTEGERRHDVPEREETADVRGRGLVAVDSRRGTVAGRQVVRSPRRVE